MAIFILEDQVFHSEILEDIIRKQYQLLGHTSEKIFCFAKTSDFLLAAKKTLEYNIYFLDLQIGKKLYSGIDVAKTIRSFDEHGVIVFVTSHPELSLDAYRSQVSAYTFIEKDLSPDDFVRLVSNSLEVYFKYSNYSKYAATDLFVLKTANETRMIPFNDILYFSTMYAHQLRIKTTEFTKEFRGNLRDIEKQDDRLLRVHQSYLINPNRISVFNRKEHLLTFPDGTQVTISRKYLENVLFCLEKMSNRTK